LLSLGGAIGEKGYKKVNVLQTVTFFLEVQMYENKGLGRRQNIMKWLRL
jgi:hypothetical protein